MTKVEQLILSCIVREISISEIKNVSSELVKEAFDDLIINRVVHELDNKPSSTQVYYDVYALTSKGIDMVEGIKDLEAKFISAYRIKHKLYK